MTIDVAADVLFAVDSAELSPEAEGRLQLAAEVTARAAAGAVGRRSHRRDGTDAYNDDLSGRRARAVADVLGPALAPVGCLVEGRGEREPVADNSTEEGAAQPPGGHLVHGDRMTPRMQAAVAGLRRPGPARAGAPSGPDDGSRPDPDAATQAAPDPSPRPTATDEPVDGPGRRSSRSRSRAAAETEVLAARPSSWASPTRTSTPPPSPSTSWRCGDLRRDPGHPADEQPGPAGHVEHRRVGTTNSEFFDRSAWTTRPPGSGTAPDLPLGRRDGTEGAQQPTNSCICP